MPHTGGNGLSLLPTPVVADADGTRATRGGARSNELLLNGIVRAAVEGKLLPTPKSHPSGPDYARINRPASGSDDLVTAVVRAETDNGLSWGQYADAIKRWESLTRPPPPPTVPGARGFAKPRINPAFSEWMMGWPAGWVTDVEGVKRVNQLRIIGNGVVSRQAAYALRLLLGGLA